MARHLRLMGRKLAALEGVYRKRKGLTAGHSEGDR